MSQFLRPHPTPLRRKRVDTQGWPRSPVAAIIYDGDCGICEAVVSWFRVRSQLRFVAYQSLDDSELASLGLSRARCSESIQAVRVDGFVLQGGRAMVEVIGRAGVVWRIAARACRIAPLESIVNLGYVLIASNRRSISRLLRRGACRVR